MLDHVWATSIQVKTSVTMTDSINNLKVKDFHSGPVVVPETMTVYDAICFMFSEDVGTLFVVDKTNF